MLALPVGALSKAYIMASFSVLLLLLQSSVVREGLRDSFCKFFVRIRR